MMVIGGVVTLPTFIFFEIKYATHPIMPVRLLRNRNVLVVCAINLYVLKCLILGWKKNSAKLWGDIQL